MKITGKARLGGNMTIGTGGESAPIGPDPIIEASHPDLVLFHDFATLGPYNVNGQTITDLSASANNSLAFGTSVPGAKDGSIALDFTNGNYDRDNDVIGDATWNNQMPAFSATYTCIVGNTTIITDDFSVSATVKRLLPKGTSGLTHTPFMLFGSPGEFLSAGDAASGVIVDNDTVLYGFGDPATQTNISVVPLTSSIGDPDGQWHSAIFVREGNNGKLYWDGQLVADVTCDTTQVIVEGVLTFADGSASGSLGEYQTDVQLDSYRVFKRALTASEVTALHNNIV